MENEIKPIKRSKELAPLSREHHEGLLLGWKIKQGLKNGTDHRLIAAYVRWFWENVLATHFKKEEQILAIHLPPANDLVTKMFSDHEEIEALLHVIALIPDEATFIQLADALHDHIRFEERELFPFAEREIAPEKLTAIQRLLEEKNPIGQWGEEFWVRK
jgi:hemerythrin-like domain-containing protein